MRSTRARPGSRRTTTESFIPQMFDYHRTGAVDFDKGCYLGQEIVARMQHRGKVNRKLFRGHGAELAAGDTLNVDGKEAGTVVAAAGEKLLAVVKSKDEAPPEAESTDGSKITLEAIERSAESAFLNQQRNRIGFHPPDAGCRH
ncbi:MAG: hypothetical protein U5O39_01085 [Gammaproteobacteria bacterium]|nr:hypothetical protein [Gammaproteobacteria bacterium]